MLMNYILFLLLPNELVLLEVAHRLDLLALLDEALVGSVVGLLQILDVLLALGLGVVVHFEGALRPQEVRVGFVVVLVAYLVSLQGKADYVVQGS